MKFGSIPREGESIYISGAGSQLLVKILSIVHDNRVGGRTGGLPTVLLFTEGGTAEQLKYLCQNSRKWILKV